MCQRTLFWVRDHVTVCLGLNVNSSAHNCGFMLSAVKAESYLSRSRSDQLCISMRPNRGG